MKALVKKKAGEGLWLEEVPRPEVAPHHVLVKVDRVGICGTDLHNYKWDDWASKTVPVPLVVGHEFVGEIVEVGSEVTDFNEVSSYHITVADWISPLITLITSIHVFQLCSADSTLATRLATYVSLIL